MPTTAEMLENLEGVLARSDADGKQIVVMMCGIAGSGKSTLSKAIVEAHPTFERISIDATIYTKHGMYSVDYPAEQYQSHQTEAHGECQVRLLELLISKNRDILLDQSFWNKADRDEVKRLVEDHGARWVLVHLSATREVLWHRIRQRSEGTRDADSAFDVTEQVLDRYLKGFEIPKGEGEIVVEVV